jgi:hypothetical protein
MWVSEVKLHATGWPIPLRGRVTLLAAALGLAAAAACSHDSPTAPRISTDCGASGPVSLAALQAVTVDCSDGGKSVTLGGGGATYLVVPQFVTNRAANQPVSYTIGVSTGAVAAIQRPGTRPSALLSSGSGGQKLLSKSRPGPLQQRVDALLRAADRKHALAFRSHAMASRSAALTPALMIQPPALGSLQDFHVLAVVDTATPVTKRVTASLDYIGQNILIYVDTTSSSSFTGTQINEMGQLFDQTLYPIDLSAFGAPSDIDQNARVIMLLSRVVNGLTHSTQCDQGFVAGFFDGFDLVSSDTSSNKGEVFYSIAPDPGGTVSCAHTVNDVLTVVPAVFLHELQHLINYSQHVLVHQSVPEEGWLDEGLSLVAQELGSLHYESEFPPPTGRTNPNQLFPDSAEGYLGTELASSYDYLLQPDTVTLTLHSDADGGLDWRGGDWLLLHWLGDQKGSAFYRSLEETPLTGTTNIEGAAGEPFPSLFGDFSLALYTDSIIGVPRSAVPQRNRFTTRNLRVLYQAYFNAAGPSSSVPTPFPIAPIALTGTVNASEVPGTTTFYLVQTAGSAAQVQVEFSAPSGAAFSPALHPQLSIFRLPD